jgi:hypothetical protein
MSQSRPDPGLGLNNFQYEIAWFRPSSTPCVRPVTVRDVAVEAGQLVSCVTCCEDRVRDGPASGEKGSKGRNYLDCIRGKRRKGTYLPEGTLSVNV